MRRPGRGSSTCSTTTSPCVGEAHDVARHFGNGGGNNGQIRAGEAEPSRHLADALSGDNDVGVRTDRDAHLVMALRGALQQRLTQCGTDLTLEQVATGVNFSLTAPIPTGESQQNRPTTLRGGSIRSRTRRYSTRSRDRVRFS